MFKMLLITNIKNKIILFLLFIIFLIEELFSFKFTINLSDCPENGQLFFQEPSSYVMEGLVSFNAHLLFVMLIISLMSYYFKYGRVSFFLTYFSLTYVFIVYVKGGGSICQTYCYYIAVFMNYHQHFTFSRRFWGRTVIVIKSYYNNSQYLKLNFWILLVFITSLLVDKFIFVVVFNPLLGFSLWTGNLVLFFFLMLQWLWMFILIFVNFLNIKFNFFDKFLKGIQSYFSRKACLHFIGNNPGKTTVTKIGTLILYTPLLASIPATAGYAVDRECQTGNYAVTRMHEYQFKNPEATHDSMYKVYRDCYTSHANSTLVGRCLTVWGVMSPAAPEAVIRGYKSDLHDAVTDLSS
jgi:hypothetical protein